MATKRKRGDSWEYIVKKKGVLPKPVSLSFRDEQEGDQYIAHLEKLLAAGILPDEFAQKREAVTTIGHAIRQYVDAVHITTDDQGILAQLDKQIGGQPISRVDYKWSEGWIATLIGDGLAPSTIRKKVGALARCLDWVVRRSDTMLIANPLRTLPSRYATTKEGKRDQSRDRRLQSGEEASIMAILDRVKPDGRERPLALPEAGALKLMFVLSLETAMRMREIYTLTWDQIDLKQRTIFLDRTKNGSKRQVPLSSVAMNALESIESRSGQLLPFWNGDASQDALRSTTTRLSQQWQRIFSAAKCADLRYHDLRHEATSRLYERTNLTDAQIAKITGHMTTSCLLRYANLRGSNLAEKLW